MQVAAANLDFETSIGPWLGRTVKIVDIRLQEAFDTNGIDLTKEQMVILKKLHEEDGLNQNELASLTYRDKSSLARLLSKMETKSYIKRKQCTKDKRRNGVFLTVEGRALFLRTIPVVKQVIHTMELGVSDAEKEFMITLLKKIQVNFTI